MQDTVQELPSKVQKLDQKGVFICKNLKGLGDSDMKSESNASDSNSANDLNKFSNMQRLSSKSNLSASSNMTFKTANNDMSQYEDCFEIPLEEEDVNV